MTASKAGVRQDIHTSDVPVICRACEARHRGVCGALTPEQLTKLSKHTTRRVVESSKQVHSNANDKNSYSNILSGVVKLTRMMADGRQQIVGLQFAPDFVGRPFERDSQTMPEAATNVRLCSFPRSVLEEIMAESPEMEHRLHQQTLKELDEAREWLLTLGRKTAYEKVASFLFLIASHIDPEMAGQNKSMKLDLPMKRGDIADYLGLTIETVSRQLTNLRKAGIIDIADRRTVLVPDIARLQSATERST